MQFTSDRLVMEYFACPFFITMHIDNMNKSFFNNYSFGSPFSDTVPVNFCGTVLPPLGSTSSGSSLVIRTSQVMSKVVFYHG